MIRCMLRSGISRSLSAFILIFMIAFLYIYLGIREELKFFGQQEKYISDKAPTGFFEQLTADRDTAYTDFFDIHINHIGFDDGGENDNTDPDSEEDILDMLTGNNKHYSDAAILWVKLKEAEPGKFAATMGEDNAFMSFMLNAYTPYGTLSNFKDELIAANEKMLKRTSALERDRIICTYELELLKKINTSLDAIPPVSGAESFLNRFNGDCIFIFFLVLFCCGMFARHRRNGYINSIKTMKCGLKKFIVDQVFSHIILFTVGYFIYALLYFLLMLPYLGDFSVLGCPIQILPQMQFSVYPITVGEYLLILFGIRYLYFLAVTCLFGFISMLSPHDMIALAVSGVMGIMPLIFSLAEVKGSFAEAVSGNVTSLIDRSDIFVVFGAAVPLAAVMCLVYLAAAGVFFLLTYFCGIMQFRTVRGKVVSSVA
ncbi:MAG: hypothetical protein HDT44_06930 [Ruminococcaceae bacterium]|nr:hypothetical protein [Oscillospiraceae bacterium]